MKSCRDNPRRYHWPCGRVKKVGKGQLPSQQRGCRRQSIEVTVFFKKQDLFSKKIGNTLNKTIDNPHLDLYYLS